MKQLRFYSMMIKEAPISALICLQFTNNHNPYKIHINQDVCFKNQFTRTITRTLMLGQIFQLFGPHLLEIYIVPTEHSRDVNITLLGTYQEDL